MQRRLSSIVAVNPKGVIGVKNSLPWRVRSDLKFFRAVTAKNIVIMGRNTFDSLQRQPLSNRLNIVLTHNLALLERRDNLLAVNSIEEALYLVDRAPGIYKEAYVIGGSTMYRQFSHFIDRYLITLVKKDVKDGDAFLDEDIIGSEDNWNFRMVSEGLADENNDADFEIIELVSKDILATRHLRSEVVREYQDKLRLYSKSGPAKTGLSKAGHANHAFAY